MNEKEEEEEEEMNDLTENLALAFCYWVVFIDPYVLRPGQQLVPLEIFEILKAIVRCKSALEFKISNELFGSDPAEKFRELCDFWFQRFFSDGSNIGIRYPLPEICQFLKKNNLTDEIRQRIKKTVHEKLTFEQFYENLPEVSEKLRVSEKLGK